MIKKILIANRGEIVRRIIRTARSMDILTVVVYSEADASALHRLDGDESYLLGPAPSTQSYLNQEKIIEIALLSNCDAIHPGYGFLSENGDFAEKVIEAGLKFIGPRPETIRLMGDKLAAKKLAKEHNIPLLAGTEEPVSDLKAAKKLAGDVGYPVLLKAAGGGGGKGMRIVKGEEDFETLFQLASSEAKQSFGDARVFIEKYLESPKHVEVQIMADTLGNVVHVFERDCSIQRRHQKVIEETPAPTMANGLRTRITEAATILSKACQYVGAGTIEFLVTPDEQFYFLEMNTRLQVEHPVSESISGIDLVAWQIEIANGKPLPLRQEDIRISGHSIQLRVYAEDIYDDFSPSLGTIFHYEEPIGTGIRIDGAVYQGYEVPIYYDPMLAKLIIWGNDRDEAINLLKRAIRKYRILGIDTTLPLGLFVLEHKQFGDGTYTTHFISQHFNAEEFRMSQAVKAKLAAHLAAQLRLDKVQEPQESKISGNWRNRLEL